jgi:hypothetical protein
VGEALLSFLDAKGVPEPVERCFIAPPRGRIGPASDAERAAVVKAGPLAGKYERTVDRESAYEVLTGRANGGQVKHDDAPAAGPGRRGQYDAAPAPTADAPPSSGPWGHSQIPQTEPAEPAKPRPRLREAEPPSPSAPVPRMPTPRTSTPSPPAPRGDSVLEATMKSLGRSLGTAAVREGTKFLRKEGPSILRGILGSLRK